MIYVLLLHLHTYLKKTRRKEKRNWIDFLSSYFKRALVTLCWFRKAHHLVTVVIRTVLFFFRCAKACVFWQPTRKDNIAFVSLAKNCHDHFSTVQNKVGEKHNFFNGGIARKIFFSNLVAVCFFSVDNEDK